MISIAIVAKINQSVTCMLTIKHGQTSTSYNEGKGSTAKNYVSKVHSITRHKSTPPMMKSELWQHSK
eukprot:10803104-Ditylum_brightwellii.AAC.1